MVDWTVEYITFTRQLAWTLIIDQLEPDSILGRHCKNF